MALGILIALILVALLTLVLFLVNHFYTNLFTRLEGYLEIGHQIGAEKITAEALTEASQSKIGGTSLQQAPAQPWLPSEGQKPLFRTLRLEQYQQGAAKWRLRIRFLLVNQGESPIALDDIHTIVYERNVSVFPFLTVSYRGEVLLQQDNMIYKEEKVYSLEPGDGMEATLALDLTRVEGAPLYGVDEILAGPVMTLFGLLVDYYELPGGDISRKALPSDCLYLFQYDNRSEEFKSVDEMEIESMRLRHQNNHEMSDLLEKVEQHLKKHQLLSPIPRK